MDNRKRPDEILTDAVARNSAIVLSLPSAGILRHHKSRFLSLAESGLWIEGTPSDVALVSELIQSGTRAGISFKTGARMINFSTTVLRRQPDFRINGTTTVEAILLCKPESIESVQRRNSYRVPVPSESEVSTRLWKIPEHFFLKDRPQARLEMLHRVTDISAGGLGVQLLPHGDEVISCTQDQRLRVELIYQQQSVIIEGRLRLPKGFDPTGKCRAGVVFKKLDADMDGRLAMALLTKAVGNLQRNDVRRYKLGLRQAG